MAGLPLGATTPRGAALMINLIGEMPEIRKLLETDGAHLHLYGKTPRPARKIGHVTLLGDSLDSLRACWEKSALAEVYRAAD